MGRRTVALLGSVALVSAALAGPGTASAAAATGAVSGVVTAAGGGAVPGVVVSLGVIGSSVHTTTAADGSYTLGGLAAGSHAICFDPPGVLSLASPYATECYSGDLSLMHPTAVHVVAGQTTAGIDVALRRKGTIDTSVTDLAGTPLHNILLTLHPLDGGADQTLAASSPTSFYTAPGTYTLCATDQGGAGYTATCYDQKSPLAPSTITLADGATTTANIVMGGGDGISGKVTDKNGTPLSGANVTVATPGGQLLRTATAPSGSYSETDLAPGSYTVCFDGAGARGGVSTMGYGRACWQDEATGAGDPVPVTAGHVTPNIDATLPALGAISGTVKDSRGAAVGNVTVVVDNGTGSMSLATAANGTYAIRGLLPGTHTACFLPPAPSKTGPVYGYLNQCWKNDATGAHLTKITIAAGATVTAINATLADAAGAHGTVTDAKGHPLADVKVQFAAATGPTATATTSAEGTYSLPLHVATYRVCAVPTPASAVLSGPPGGTTGGDSTTGYLGNCKAAFTPAAGVLGPAETFTLASAAAVAGTVSDTATDPLDGVYVVVTPTCANSCFPPLAAYTDGSGQYSVGFLPAAAFTVCFYGSIASYGTRSGYGNSCYQSRAVGSGTPVTLKAGTTTTDIDGTLTKLG